MLTATLDSFYNILTVDELCRPLYKPKGGTFHEPLINLSNRTV